MNVEKLGGKTMTAKISVIMGSTSDWETMKEACQILDEFGVSYEKKVVSAHRTPDLMFEYAQNARKKGIQMPGGVPVATTAIGKAGAINAGLLAIQMLSMYDLELEAKLAERRSMLAKTVIESSDQLG